MNKEFNNPLEFYASKPSIIAAFWMYIDGLITVDEFEESTKRKIFLIKFKYFTIGWLCASFVNVIISVTILYLF